MILMIDNYDSFVYNLYQYFLILGEEVRVVRNDKITAKDVEVLNPSCLVISPGPCTPREAGISVELIQKFYNRFPILGICLGHQSLVYSFGGKVIRAGKVMHGKTSLVKHDNKGVFTGLNNPTEVMRYHSLVAEDVSLPDVFEVTSVAQDDGEIMGIRHKKYPVEGIQFHPESIKTPDGMKMLKNFLDVFRVK